MGCFLFIETAGQGGRPTGKINASLNERLNAVKWGEYRLHELFDIKTSKSTDKNKIVFKENGEFDFVGRSNLNNGVQGKIGKLSYEPNAKNTFSLVQVGESVCLFRASEWYASQNIFVLTPKYEALARAFIFVSSVINKALGVYKSAYAYPTLDDVKEITVVFPIKDGQIDFKFMESFIAELEAQRIAELEAYLSVLGLNDYILTEEERKIVNDFKTLNWGKYKIGSLFERIDVQKLLYKAKNLPQEPISNFILPCLTSSFQNQGLNYYAPKDGATVLRNVISIPSNSDVYRAYYQSREFTVLSDAYAIRWKLKDNDILPQHYLFIVMCINKVTDLPIYSHKNKLGGWNVVKEKFICLPEKDGKIDFDFMATFISAIQKLVIKNVVLYANREIDETKKYCKLIARQG